MLQGGAEPAPGSHPPLCPSLSEPPQPRGLGCAGQAVVSALTPRLGFMLEFARVCVVMPCCF